MDFVQAIAVLDAVDVGKVQATITTPRELTCEPEYLLSNGWRVRVFEDVGDWDYIDSIAAPGEDWFDLWLEEGLDWSSDQHRLRIWSPGNLDHWAWNIKGVSPNGYRID